MNLIRRFRRRSDQPALPPPSEQELLITSGLQLASRGDGPRGDDAARRRRRPAGTRAFRRRRPSRPALGPQPLPRLRGGPGPPLGVLFVKDLFHLGTLAGVDGERRSSADVDQGGSGGARRDRTAARALRRARSHARRSRSSPTCADVAAGSPSSSTSTAASPGCSRSTTSSASSSATCTTSSTGRPAQRCCGSTARASSSTGRCGGRRGARRGRGRHPRRRIRDPRRLPARRPRPHPDRGRGPASATGGPSGSPDMDRRRIAKVVIEAPSATITAGGSWSARRRTGRSANGK